MNGIDIDMAADMGGAVRGKADCVAHRLAVRVDADGDPVLAFEVDALAQHRRVGCSRARACPRSSCRDGCAHR